MSPVGEVGAGDATIIAFSYLNHPDDTTFQISLPYPRGGEAVALRASSVRDCQCKLLLFHLWASMLIIRSVDAPDRNGQQKVSRSRKAGVAQNSICIEFQSLLYPPTNFHQYLIDSIN